MTFEDFCRDIDEYGAFSDFVTVAEAKKIGLIPSEYVSYFPDYCECGSENIITRDLQQPQCCNPRCLIKQGYSLSEMFNRFQCKGLGPARCTEIVKQLSPQFQYNSYIEILDFSWDMLPLQLKQQAYSYDLLNSISKIKQSVMTFPQMVRNLAIPALGDKAVFLLDGINSFTEMEKKFRSCGGLSSFCLQKGIQDKMFLFWFRQYALDIAIAEKLLQNSLRKSGLLKIEVCITGFLYLHGKRITKEKFLEICNNSSVVNNVQLFEVVQNKAMMHASHIIADSPSRSAKYLAGLERGEEIDIDGEVRSVLMTSNEFLNFLETLKSKLVGSVLEETQRIKHLETF